MKRTEQTRPPQGALARGIAGLAALGCRHPRVVLLLLLLSCGGSLLYTFQNLTFQTSRNDLISQGKDYLRRWKQYVAEFGDDEDMVAVVRGSDPAAMRAALDELAGKIRAHPDHFDRLFYQVDLAHLQDRALLFMSAEDIRRIQDGLKAQRLLLDLPVFAEIDPLFSWQSLTLKELLNEGERRVQAHRNAAVSPAAPDPFLHQLAAICEGASASLGDPGTYRNPWLSILPGFSDKQETLARPQYFFSQDGTLAFLMVRPTFREAGSFTSEQACVETLRGLLEEARARFPNLEFGLTGLPVLENDEMQASQNDSQRASWLALLGVALLYLVVYRGLRYPLMTVVSLLLGTVWALGWLTLTVGHLNILSSAFAVMLIGMGDYGVLWVARYQQECGAGLDPVRAMRQTALHVGPSILTAACTTALAFFATMLADLKAVAELGWIAGSGVLLCAVACFVAMPPMLVLFGPRPRQARAENSPLLSLKEAQERRRTWIPWLIARPRGVLLGTLLAAGLLGWQALRVTYDHNLLHLQDPDLDSVRWEKVLIEKTAGASWHALSTTTTREEALALKKKFEQLPQVSRVIEVASLVPLDQEHKVEQLKDIQERLRRLPQRGQLIPHRIPEAADVCRAALRLQGEVRRLARAQPGLALGTLAKNLNTLVALLNSPRPDAPERLRDYEQNMTRDLAGDLHRLRDASTPCPIEVADIPPCLRERFVGQNGKWLLRVYSKDCLWEYQPLESFVAQVCSVDPDATGKPFTTLAGLKAMKDGFLWAGVYALLAMILVLLLDFGSVKHLILSLTPLALGFLFTLGFMGLFQVPLNPANLIAFPLILGVGADNGVHVVHDYRQRLRGSRYLLDYATGRGILIAALTTVLGFGTLLIASHRGMSSLGLALTLGVSCCMLTSLVFLPCLLSLLSVRRWSRPITLPFPRKKAA